MRRGSFALPLILIGLGTLFLINNAVPQFSVWRLLADWWPALLIAFGVLRVIEVLAFFGSGRPRQSGFRPMSFGWILVIVAVGVAMSLPHHMQPHWRWAPIKAGSVELFGEEFTYPVSQTSEAGAAKRIVLDNLRGNITVTGGDGTQIRADGNKVIHAFNRNAADTVDRGSAVAFFPEGDTIFVRSPEPSSPEPSRVELDLQIAVPKSMSVETRGRSGDLTVNSIDGQVDVSGQRGDVRLQDIGGNAKLDVERSELVRASGVQGSVDIEGKGRDIQVERVRGTVTVNGRFSGTLDFNNLEKPLHFESEQTDLRIEKLPGNISMSLGELHGSNLTGPTRFVTRERDVHLDDFTGPLEIELGKGDLVLQPASGKPLSRIDARSRSGNIEIALPSNGAFDLKATAHQGEVSNDFGDGIANASSQGRTNTLRSTSPSGPTISLNTDRGTISVRKMD